MRTKSRKPQLQSKEPQTSSSLLESNRSPSWDELEELDRLNHDESFEAQNSRLINSSPTFRFSRWKSCPSEMTPDERTENEFVNSGTSERLPYYYQSTVQAGHYRRGEPMNKVFDRGNFFPSHFFKSNAKGNLRSLFEGGRNGDGKISKSESVQSLDGRQTTSKGKRKGYFKKLVGGLFMDWLFLALLGASMAVCSLAMDIGIEKLGTFHIKLLNMTRTVDHSFLHTFLGYVSWVLYSVVLVSGSALFCHFVSPQAVGSGIPEMKTVLRGVYLKEYLSLKTLVAKMVGLTLSLGSQLPIGKEGPFVHVASIMANLLSRLVNSFDSVYINESRHTEMLAAGCAVGVSAVFSAPVGGVLFSIEVTSVYFAVRNYWRGFFAATCSATVFRLLRVILQLDLTVVAFYQTYFPKEAFFPEELPLFALIGLICGFGSAAFIYTHRKMVLFLRSNRFCKKIFQQHWYLYPVIISLVISSITFPDGFGILLGGERKFSLSARDFFKNCTWTAHVNSSQYCTDRTMIQNWIGKDENLNIFLVLSCFILTYFFLSALASTIPIPSGTFGPAFVLGGAFGRIVGEIVAVYYPDGVREEEIVQVYPGVYAVVGAAAFCGGVTHTVSVAVIVFELTGQLVYLLPVMIAVLIANAVCSYLQPSIYDSIITIKALPFLPDIKNFSTNFHGIKVEQIMTSAVRYLTPKTTYGELQTLLVEDQHLKSLPVVQSRQDMILLGSCSRTKLLQSLEKRVGSAARQTEAHRRITEGFNELARRCRSSTNPRPGLLLSPTNLERNKEESRSVPNKLNFYYRGRPPTLEECPRPVSPIQFEPTVQNLIIDENKDEGSQVRKMSRFTVTNVPIGEKEASDPSSTEMDSESRDRLSSDGDDNSDTVSRTKKRRHNTFTNTVTSLARTLTHLNSGRHFPRNAAEIDLYGDDRKNWETEQLSHCIKLNEIGVDTAPFQLVGNTSMLKVHSLFSLLGLNRAYVTRCGRLVGVVALRDIRMAIEKVQSGQLYAQGPKMEIEVSDDSSEAQRRLRSMSIHKAQLDEDGKMDRLNPQPEVISRTATWASFKDGTPSGTLLDSGILNDDSDGEDEIPIRSDSRPTSDSTDGMNQSEKERSADTAIPIDSNEKMPRINVTPPTDE
ncbi:Chloride channel protein 2 [Aphelenchoides besseyi]|nr:Chloride channel protein 2 [Aphelenchoides besseyi]